MIFLNAILLSLSQYPFNVIKINKYYLHICTVFTLKRKQQQQQQHYYYYLCIPLYTYINSVLPVTILLQKIIKREIIKEFLLTQRETEYCVSLVVYEVYTTAIVLYYFLFYSVHQLNVVV